MLYVFGIVLLAALTALAVIDIRTYRLPDILTLPLILLGCTQAYFLYDTLASSLIGALLGYTVFVGLELSYKKLRQQDGLGRGDAKLLAAGGAWCGWYGLPFIVLFASGFALLSLILPSVRRYFERGYIPFGPYLCWAIGCVWLAGRIVQFGPTG